MHAAYYFSVPSVSVPSFSVSGRYVSSGQATASSKNTLTAVWNQDFGTKIDD